MVVHRGESNKRRFDRDRLEKSLIMFYLRHNNFSLFHYVIFLINNPVIWLAYSGKDDPQNRASNLNCLIRHELGTGPNNL